MRRSDPRKLQPYQQGDLDGLCGLYAVINAIRLVVDTQRRLNRTECALLFVEGIGSLAAHGELNEAVWGGMDYGTCYRLARQLCRAVSKMTTFTIYAQRPFSRRRSVEVHEVVARLRSITTTGAVGIISTAEHWTVVSACTEKRLKLFDSSQSHWFAINGLRTAEQWNEARHIVVPAALIIIATSPPK